MQPIVLPFPPSSLSGHAKGNWHGKSGVTAKWRAWAKAAALEVKAKAPATGDIVVHVRFVPPDRRGGSDQFPHTHEADFRWPGRCAQGQRQPVPACVRVCRAGSAWAGRDPDWGEGISTPIYRVRERQANDAFAAHKALVLMEVRSPELAENPVWTAARRAAFAQFVSAFEMVGSVAQ